MALWQHLNVTAHIWPLEHCPPHVTFVCRADSWTARIEFSMATAHVGLMDVKPLVNAPKASLLNALANQVLTRLHLCRQTWWNTQDTVCLDNKAVWRVAANAVSLARGAGLSGKIVAGSGSYRRLGRAYAVVADVRWPGARVSSNEQVIP
jgi:hypothetical protein